MMKEIVYTITKDSIGLRIYTNAHGLPDSCKEKSVPAIRLFRTMVELTEYWNRMDVAVTFEVD